MALPYIASADTFSPPTQRVSIIMRISAAGRRGCCLVHVEDVQDLLSEITTTTSTTTTTTPFRCIWRGSEDSTPNESLFRSGSTKGRRASSHSRDLPVSIARRRSVHFYPLMDRGEARAQFTGGIQPFESLHKQATSNNANSSENQEKRRQPRSRASLALFCLYVAE